MKRVAVAAVAFVGVFCAVFADDVSLSANATLKDGSVVKGEFLTKVLIIMAGIITLLHGRLIVLKFSLTGMLFAVLMEA